MLVAFSIIMAINVSSRIEGIRTGSNGPGEETGWGGPPRAEMLEEPGDVDSAVAVAVDRKVTSSARRVPASGAAPAIFSRP